VKGNVSACTAPDSGKPLSLIKANSDAEGLTQDAKTEAKSAERRAQEDIKDASS